MWLYVNTVQYNTGSVDKSHAMQQTIASVTFIHQKHLQLPQSKRLLRHSLDSIGTVSSKLN